MGAYVAANARLDADAMLACFTRDAVVRDDGGRHEGHAAIRTWIDGAIIAARAVFTPGMWREEAGRIILRGPTEGEFPGSPIDFTITVTLRDGAIAALEVA
jgi:hypothetical protein